MSYWEQIIHVRGLRVYRYTKMPSCAMALLNSETVKGKVIFTQKDPSSETRIQVELHIEGSSNQNHGMHVHEFGDLTNGCVSAGAHFNPEGQTHGSTDSKVRHYGDLGNIKTDQDGNCKMDYTVDVLPLHGEPNIYGRSIVVHAKEDDLGRGNNEESLKTGNAGARIACAIIGVCKCT